MTHRSSVRIILSCFVLAGCLAGCSALSKLGTGVPTYRIALGEMQDVYSGRDAIYNLTYQHAWRPEFQRRTHMTTAWRQEPLGGRSRVVFNLFERGAGTYQVMMDVEYQAHTPNEGWAFAEVPVFVQDEARVLADDITRALDIWYN